MCRSVVGATPTEVEKIEATSAKPGQEPDLKGRVKAVDVTIPGVICNIARHSRAPTASWLRWLLPRAEFLAATVVAVPSRAQALAEMPQPLRHACLRRWLGSRCSPLVE